MNEIILTSGSKIRIAVNHYSSSKREEAIIICPGCFMTKDAAPFKRISESFAEEYDVLAMDFRGHGRSSGLYTFTAKETEDLSAVVKFAKEKYSKIAIMGFSLGAATTLIYASSHKDVESIIAVSAPTDFLKIENHFLKKEAVIPTVKKFELGKSPSLRPGNIFLDKVKPIDVVSKIAPIPVLFISGDKDPIVHAHHAEELHDEAMMPKAIEVFEDGFHADDIYAQEEKKFIKVCKDWLEKTLGEVIKI
jgi:pimeloyl-ACP methyl ester carboxylesterase